MIGTLAGLRAYATARGFSLPVDDAPVTAALQRATDYITHEYLANWRTSPLPDPLPVIVEEATYEAAMLESRTPNFFNRQFTPGEQKVLVAAGPIRWERINATGGRQLFSPVSTRIESMLKRYTTNGGLRVTTVLRS